MEVVERKIEDLIKEQSQGFLKIDENIIYVPPFYKVKDSEGKFKIPKDYWTLIEVKQLTQKECAICSSNFANLTSQRSSDEDKNEAWESMINIIDSKVVRVKNMRDHKGNVVEFKGSLENYFNYNLMVNFIGFLISSNSLSEEELEGLKF